MRRQQVWQRAMGVGIVCAAGLVARAASADDAPAASAHASDDSAESALKNRVNVGRGVALGFDNGLWGASFGQELRLTIPVFEHVAFGLRGTSALAFNSPDPVWHVGGRAEVIGHTPVYLNLVRLYGAGGPEVIARAQGGSGEKVLVGGGGEFGFEFFVSPKMSFYVEIGGHGGNEWTAGGTAMGGMMFYPFGGS